MSDYPSDDDLKRIREWPHTNNFAGLIDFARSVWWSEDWCWGEAEDADDGPVYTVSTGGWSGNEALIEAMQHNFLFWSSHFVQHRRGGHYMLKRRVEEKL